MARLKKYTHVKHLFSLSLYVFCVKNSSSMPIDKTTMQTLLVKDKINYTGAELSSHFAYRRFDLSGDSLVAFCGACSVGLDEMVDLADVKDNAPIYSENMLHFIAEFFGGDLEKTVLRQRLLISIIKDEIALLSGSDFVRRGDDIYDGEGKLSVSIATASPVSCMIHTGINISSKNTPVKTAALDDYGIDAYAFAQKVLSSFSDEISDIHHARCKVRGVK